MNAWQTLTSRCAFNLFRMFTIYSEYNEYAKFEIVSEISPHSIQKVKFDNNLNPQTLDIAILLLFRLNR